MTGSERAGVTPAGIRDGTPEVLRALVAARGSAVLSYCRAVCPPEDAGRAAAEAFARFRAAVVDAPDVTTIDPDALLLGATRHAAASMARTSRPAGRSARKDDTCAAVPGLLAARAAGMISVEESERLASHLERCPACRGLAEDFERAEEAYRTATAVPVPPATERTVLAALEAAAPVVVHDVALDEPAPLDPEAPVETEDAAELAVPPADELDTADVHDASDEDEDEGDGAGLEDHAHDPFYDGPLHPDDEDEDEEFPEDDETAAPPEPRDRPRLPRIALPSLPRPRLTRPSRGPAPTERRDLRPVLLPAVVVLAALVVFLAASGVFGGDDPEPPKAERQRPELRVEQPVTTPLPVEPVVEPPRTTTTPSATTTPTTPTAPGTTAPATPETTPEGNTTPPADGTAPPDDGTTGDTVQGSPESSNAGTAGQSPSFTPEDSAAPAP